MALDTLGGDFSDASVRAALGGGQTRLDTVRISLALDQGLASTRGDAVASGGARLEMTGGIDLPDATVDLGLDVTPAGEDAPRIGLRLSGDARDATATPDLGDLARWRALRP